MVQLNARKGLAIVVLAVGALLFTAKPAQAQLRDNRLGIFVTFPGKGMLVVGFITGNSPALRAGIQVGDVIEKLGDKHVNTPQQRQNHRDGPIVHAHVFRASNPKRKQHFNVKIGN